MVGRGGEVGVGIEELFCFLMLIVVGGNLQPLALSGRLVYHRGYSLYADLCNCYIILPVNNNIITTNR